MGQFDKLKERLAIKKDVTAEFPIVQTTPEIVLVLRPATQANPGYFNDTMRDIGLKLRRQQGREIDAETLAESRKEDRVLFVKHVIVGWRNVVKDDGSPVEFSATAAAELVAALPDDIFDEVRTFAKEDNNFRPKRTDVEAAAKN